MALLETIDNTYGSGLVATITTASASATTVWIPKNAVAILLYSSVLAKYCFDSTYAAPSATITNQVQSINTVGTPTGGTFTLLGPFSGVATSALTFDESAADVKTALAALTDFDTGDITAAGGALPTEITLTFTGVYAGVAVPVLKIGTNSLTGGTTTDSLKIAQKTAVVNPYSWIEAGSQQVIPTHGTAGTRYLHLINDSGAGAARVSFLRG